MTKQLTRRRAIAAKVEVTEGTAETLAAADSTFDVYDPVFNPDVPLFRRQPARSSLSPLQGLSGSKGGSISFGVEVKGSGTAATAPGFDDLLRACGFQQFDPWQLTAPGGNWTGTFTAGERVTQATSNATGIVMFEVTTAETLWVVPLTGTFDAVNSVSGDDSGAAGIPSAAAQSIGIGYRPDSDMTSVPSLTIGGYFDGVRHVIKGARGTVAFEGTRDEILRMNFEFTGVYDATTDVALISAGPDTTVPPVFLGVDARLADDYAAVFESIGINMNTTVTLRSNAGVADGWLSALLTDRAAQMTIDPEATLVATHDFMGKLRAGSPGTFEMSLGSVSGNRFRFGGPLIQYSGISDDDRNSIAVAGLTCDMSGKDTAGDDELYILHD